MWADIDLVKLPSLARQTSRQANGPASYWTMLAVKTMAVFRENDTSNVNQSAVFSRSWLGSQWNHLASSPRRQPIRCLRACVRSHRHHDRVQLVQPVAYPATLENRQQVSVIVQDAIEECVPGALQLIEISLYSHRERFEHWWSCDCVIGHGQPGRYSPIYWRNKICAGQLVRCTVGWTDRQKWWHRRRFTVCSDFLPAHSKQWMGSRSKSGILLFIHRYFVCPPNYGIFVPLAKVSLSPLARKSRLSRAGSKESLTSFGTIGSITSTNTSRLRMSAQVPLYATYTYTY